MNRPSRRERHGERPVAKRLPIIFRQRENKGKSGVMSQIHATTQKLSLVAVPEKGDKMRVTSRSWDEAVVICRLPSSSCAASTVA